MTHDVSSRFMESARHCVRRRWGLAVTLIMLFSVGSNAVAATYARPDVPDHPNWSQLEGRQLTSAEVIQPDWWKAFGDPYLNGLVEQAVNNALDLKIAALRLDQAGIQLKKDRFAAKPKVTARPASGITRQGEKDSAATTYRDTEALGLDLTWELDLWGKIRHELQAANARYHATEMDWRATHLTLVSTVAQRYFEIRQYDEQIGQQVQSKAQAENLLQVYQAQYEEGMIPQTQILNQQAEISSLANRLIDLRRSRDEGEIKLAVLLGLPPGDIKVPVAGLRESVHMVDVPLMLPADMLARRPDVLKAEYGVLAAYHAVGKARLARLPTFSLSAVAKTGASLVSTLINSWSFGLAASWQGLFDRNIAIDVKVSEADAKVASEEYRRVVLGAFEEVEVALLNVDARKRQMKELDDQIAALAVVQKVQEQRLGEGLISQLEFFDTERNLLSAQQEVLSTYQQLLTATVTLYKALGGGWPPEKVADLPSRTAESQTKAR